MNNPYRGKRVAIYARASTKRQANVTQSIKGQIDCGHAWVSQKGATLAGIWVDARVSGTDNDRAEFQELMAIATRNGGLKAAPVDIVLVEARSRLCRDAAQFIEVKAELHRCGVQIVSTSHTGGDEPTSKRSSDLLAVFDALYSADS